MSKIFTFFGRKKAPEETKKVVENEVLFGWKGSKNGESHVFYANYCLFFDIFN